MFKTGSRRGDDSVDGSSNGGSLYNRFRSYFEALIANAARRAIRRTVNRISGTYDSARGRVDDAISETFRKFDLGLQSQSTVTDKQPDTWVDLTYFIGNKVDYERLVRATQMSGMRQRTYYFKDVPTAAARAVLFGPKYKRMVRLSKRNT